MKRYALAWLASLCVFGSGSLAAELDLQKPPANTPKNLPKLSPLLIGTDGKKIDSNREWARQRKSLQLEWEKVLGPIPKKREPVKLSIVSTERTPLFLRHYVKYQVEAGVENDGYLLIPTLKQKKFPAVVVFHGTTSLQAKGVSGVDTSIPEKMIGMHLAERGYVAFCPRNYIFTEGADYAGNAQKLLNAHPEWTGMTKMVFDGIRAVDVLESLPEVDRKHIGAIGHSLGGKEALYAAGFDDRIKAAVTSEGGIGLKFSNWDAIWYLGPKINSADFKLDNHQVLAFAAPRAVLLLAGDASDNDGSWTFIQSAMEVYGLLGKPENVGWFNHHEGHRYSPNARAVAEAFLDRHLKGR